VIIGPLNKSYLYHNMHNKENQTLNKLTTISISRSNYQILKNLGKTGDSFNDVLTEILEKAKKSKSVAVVAKEEKEKGDQ